MLMTVACYMLQLYADFAGYTNIALGVGKLFGVDGPPNFHAPFAAVNIQEFWRRWHMSLTSWVTDYLFTPLSMSLRGLGQVGLVLCIMLNMLIIGLWHGLTLNFLVFGLLQGVLVSVTALVVMSRSARTPRSRAANRSTRSQAGASLDLGAGRHDADLRAHEFFHDLLAFADLGEAVSILKQVLAVSPSGSIGWSDMPASLTVPAWICMAIALYVGAGAPAPKGWSARIDDGCAAMAAIWRLPVLAIGLVYRRIRPIRLWAILIG